MNLAKPQTGILDSLSLRFLQEILTQALPVRFSAQARLLEDLFSCLLLGRSKINPRISQQR
jgi:hypothetical protein